MAPHAQSAPSTQAPSAQAPSTEAASTRARESSARKAPRSRPRALRSSTVILGSMGALAAALSGCASEPDKRCVDRDSYDAVRGYKTLSASECAPGGAQSGATTQRSSTHKTDAMQANATQTHVTQTHAVTDRSPASKPRTARAAGTEPRWYYGGEVEGRRAEGGTFSHDLAVERGGFGCDDDDSSSSGGSFGG
ncbi:hypothetical protein [Streptomyces sp. ODS28]|uniref:hypothetical protein n=1 Tax=Streptomyces sp. ODS28 TaxID=3136688 RepID=UPI0031E8C660